MRTKNGTAMMGQDSVAMAIRWVSASIGIRSLTKQYSTADIPTENEMGIRRKNAKITKPNPQIATASIISLASEVPPAPLQLYAGRVQV